MLRSGAQGEADVRAVLGSYDLHRSAQCFSISQSQRFVAIGSHHEVRILELSLDNKQCSITERAVTAHVKQNVHVIDLCWHPGDAHGHRLAVSYGNGELKVFTFLVSQSLSPIGMLSNTPVTNSALAPVPSAISSSSSPASLMMSASLPVTSSMSTLAAQHLSGHSNQPSATKNTSNVNSSLNSNANPLGGVNGGNQTQTSPTPLSLRPNSSQSTRASLSTEWSCDKSEHGDGRYATRIKWHPVDMHLLFTTHVDGAVRVFDTRIGIGINNGKSVAVYKGRRSPLRDLAFSPFDANIFADVGDTGVLRVWDRRQTDRPLLASKQHAHKSKAQCVSWNPYREGVVATGGADKTIRIWDATVTHSSTAQSVLSVSSSGKESTAVNSSAVSSATSSSIFGSERERQQRRSSYSSSYIPSTHPNAWTSQSVNSNSNTIPPHVVGHPQHGTSTSPMHRDKFTRSSAESSANDQANALDSSNHGRSGPSQYGNTLKCGTFADDKEAFTSCEEHSYKLAEVLKDIHGNPLSSLTISKEPNTTSAPSLSHSSKEKELEPQLVCVIQPQGEVQRLLWGYCLPLSTTTSVSSSSSSSSSSASTSSTTISNVNLTGAAAASGHACVVSCLSDAMGHISLWSDERDRRHVPDAIVRGHGSDACLCMDWVDLPLAFTPSLVTTINAMTANLSGSSGKLFRRNQSNNVASAGGNTALANTIIRSASPHNSLASSLLHALSQIGTHRCLLSLSREGRLFIQTPTQAYRPWQGLSHTVCAFASTGDCAFARERMTALHFAREQERLRDLVFLSEQQGMREKIIHVTESEIKGFSSSSPLSPLFGESRLGSDSDRDENDNASDDTDAYASTALVTRRQGMQQQQQQQQQSLSTTTEKALRNDFLSNETGFFQGHERGLIHFGAARIHSLLAARQLRGVRQRDAEASVFDPALIQLLAKEYAMASHGLTIRTAVSDTLTHALREEEKGSGSGRLPTPEQFAVETEGAVNHPELLSTVVWHEGEVRRRELFNETIAYLSCQHNLSVAQSAGLRCRAALWSAVLAMLPCPTDTRTLFTDKNGKSKASKTVPEHSISASTLPASFSSLLITVPVLADVLQELVQGGDAQHYLTMCAILNRVQLLALVHERAQIALLDSRRLFLSHLELLMRMSLFPQVCQLVHDTDDEAIASRFKRETEITIKCGHCRKDLPKRVQEDGSMSAVNYCLQCKRHASSCAVCLMPVRGLLQWCSICAHGGHRSCMQKWFQSYSCCPCGCGHDCCAQLMIDPDTSAPSGVLVDGIGSLPQHNNRDKSTTFLGVRDGVQDSLTRKRTQVKHLRRQQLRAYLNAFP